MRLKVTEESAIIELLKYISVDPIAGTAIWVEPRNHRLKRGDPVGTPHTQGYTSVSIKMQNGVKKVILLHRVIWYYVKGWLPEKPYVLDHIQGIAAGNGINNLQTITQQENQFKKKEQKNNTSGYRGVVYESRGIGSWTAQCRKDGKNYTSHGYTTKEQAAEAYNQLASRLHGEYAVLNKIEKGL